MTVSCMKDYVKPSLKYNNDVMVLHCGSNDLRGEKTPAAISDEIIELANSIKKADNEIMISSLVVRDDALHDKGLQVNALLKIKCAKNNYFYIDNGNISNIHLNGSGLHLNSNGTFALANNFLDSFKL